MARSALQKVYADFTQGFVTVANPLAYPEGTLKDIVNFDINDNGTLSLRAGLRQESLTTIDTLATMANVNNQAVSVHIWDNVDNVGGDKIAVVQVGMFLYLFEMLDDGVDLDNQLGSRISLALPSEGIDKAVSTASGNGRLFVAHPDMIPKMLTKTGPTSFSVDIIDMEIRDTDLWIGHDEFQTGLHSSVTLYAQHEYNLRNGGWPLTAKCSTNENPDTGVVDADPVDYSFNKTFQYPSVGISFFAGRAGGGSSTEEQTAFTPWAIKNDYYGNSFAPRGRFIKKAYGWSRNGNGNTAYLGSGGTTTASATYTWDQFPTAIEFYAGRLWFAGVKGYTEVTSSVHVEEAPIDVNNTIYFSQQSDTSLSKIGKCYQENDPTAEDINQLLATDGGTLSIRGAGEILSIKAFGTSLIVFSSEGIWAISGTDGDSFTATGFSVNKISSIGPSSKKTITADGNNIYYIANDAIYILTTDQVTGLPTPQDITSGKIKDFYTDIPYREKERARAFFDRANRNLFMFYSDQEEDDTDFPNLYYNKCLIFNQDLGSFYKYDITVNNHYIVDGLFYNKDQLVEISEPVTIDEVVVTLDGVAVTLDSSFSTASLNGVQLLTVVDNSGNAEFTFSSFTDIADFQDWGSDYTGFVETGFDTAGDIMRDSLKAPVLISHMERTEDGFEVNPAEPSELILTNRSSCLLSYGWDWATNYSNQRQIYRFNRNYIPSGASDPFNYGVDIITTRNRIRGKGHSLGLRIDSEAGKDCKVLGIGILYTMARDI